MGNRSFRLLAATVLSIWLGIGAQVCRAAGVGERTVPPAAQLSKAEVTIKKLFRDEYQRRSPADRLALAKKLIDEGAATPNDPAARFVCYREADTLATLAGDLPTAFAAANAIARDFAIDPKDVQKMKAATYIALVRQIESPEVNALLAELGLNLLDQMVAAENFDDVDRLFAPIDAAAVKTKQLSLVTRVQSRRDEVTNLRRDAQKLVLAEETLRKSPDDPEANLAVGRHLAFGNGAWDQALPVLVKSSDTSMRNLAKLELSKPADVKTQLQLADGWWALADRQTGGARTSLQKHAQEEYRRILPSLAGADAAHVQGRLPVTAPPAAAPAPASPSPAAPAPAPPQAVAATTRPGPAQAQAVTRYWWTTLWQPAGARIWVKVDADNWRETDPSGFEKNFRVISHDNDPELGPGTTVRYLADPNLIVWMPELVDGNKTYFRRTDAANKWVLMGAIHIGDPPAAATAPAPTEGGAVAAPADQPRAAFSGHRGWIMALAFSPNGRVLASASVDNTVRLWDAASGATTAIFRGAEQTKYFNCVAFSPDGKTVAAGNTDMTVRVWETRAGSEPLILSGHTNAVRSVAFSPNGKLIASGSRGEIMLWEASTGKCTFTLQGIANRDVPWVAFSPDGATLATACDGDAPDETIKLWDVASGKQTAAYTGHAGGVWAVAFSPDGKLLASGSTDMSVKLWDLATGKARSTLTGHRGTIGCLAFSPNGQILASSSADGTIKFWDIATGRELATITAGHVENGRIQPVRGIAFNPDGKTLASGGHYKVLDLWNVPPEGR